MKNGLFSRLRSLTPMVRSESGFTLIEIAVSSLIIVLIAGAVAGALIASSHVSAEERQRSQADQVAQQDQERLRGMSAQELLSANNQTRNVTLQGTVYTVTTTTQFLNSQGGNSCGSGGNGAGAFYRAESKVTWSAQSAGNRPAVVEGSVISPPAGGVLLTQVQDQTGAGLAGVSVTASGTDAASGTTDANGCVVLSGLPSGNYALAIADNGLVDENGNPSPLSRTAAVADTGTSTPTGGNPIHMALPGYVNASFVANTGASTVSSQSDALSWYGGGPSYQMSQAKTKVPGNLVTTLQSGPLFPFAYPGPSYANNYQVWAGKCPQMQPPTGVDTASVSPGSTLPMNVLEPAVKLTATYNNFAVTPSDVRITFASSSTPSCSDSWLVPVVANSGLGNLAYPGQPFASTATSGASASASSGTGTLTACADYRSGNSYYKASSQPFTNTTFSGMTAVSVAITNSTTGQC